MDPLTALLVAILLTSLSAKTVGAAATDVIATARGKTPPSQEKWQARQKARAARGEAPEKDPGPMRRRWRNAVEERNVKAAQKHQARMELLNENAGTNVARHKDKLRKRAERWDKVGAKVSELGASSWEAAKTAATAASDKAKQAVEKAKEAYDESQAWKENARRDLHDPATELTPDTDSGDEPAATATDTDGPDAKVLPLRRPQPPASSGPAPASADDLDPPVSATAMECEIYDAGAEDQTALSTTPEGNTVTEQAQNTSVEITDLNSAIDYCAATAKYTSTVESTLADLAEQIVAAMQGLTAEAASHEGALASIADEGFREKVTGCFTSAIDALTVAVAALKGAGEGVTTASDQVAVATGRMRDAMTVFSNQQGVAETVTAAKEDAGVSKNTDFYAHA